MNLQPILQIVVLSLLVYVFLWLALALPKGLQSRIIPYTTKAPAKHREKKRGRGRIIRLGPGRFIIQEPERRPRGKLGGGRGGGRRRPQSWDRVKEARPKTCPWCGANIPPEKRHHKVYDRVVIDLERLERRLVGTRTLWIIYWMRCPSCRELVSGGGLVNAPKGHTFGYGLLAYAVHHRVGKAKWTTTDIASELEFILEGDAPTDQTIRDWLGKVASKNRELFKELLELVKEEGYLEVDESGLPLDGLRWWMWIISARAVTLYLASPTRGHQAIEEELADYLGTLVVDFWRAYDRLPQAKQRCLVHLYLEVTDLLLKHAKAQARLEAKLERSRMDRRRKAGEKPRRGRPKRLMILSREEAEKIRSQIRMHGEVAEALYPLARLLLQAMGKKVTAREAKERLQTLLEEHQGARGRCPQYRRIGERMLNHLPQLFRFLEDPEVESCSTNRAERRVKEYAELRRAVPCWRSPKSARDHAQLLSYTVTWSQAGLDPWNLSLLLARGECGAISQQVHQALDRPPPRGIQTTQPVSGGFLDAA